MPNPTSGRCRHALPPNVLMQLNVRKLLEDRRLGAINIITQKVATESGCTRFEDRHRLPLGIAVNLSTFAAKLLAQVREFNKTQEEVHASEPQASLRFSTQPKTRVGLLCIFAPPPDQRLVPARLLHAACRQPAHALAHHSAGGGRAADNCRRLRVCSRWRGAQLLGAHGA